MSLTVAQIGEKAFDAVGKKLSGVIFDAVLQTNRKGEYNSETGSYDSAQNSNYNCRLLVDKTPRDGKVGTYTVSEKERVLLVEGLTVIPKENQKLTFNNDQKTITFVDDILFSGSMFYVVVK